MKLIIRLLINAIALVVADALVPGIMLADDWVSIAFVAVIFGVINAVIKPIVMLFSLPLLLLTLGLFTLVINALMLGMTAYLTDALAVNGFWPAVFGSIIISIISVVLSAFVSDEE